MTAEGANGGPGVPRRPNVLLIMTDQQRADHTGFGGNAVLETPHLDALAARGTVFDRAMVANPICMPNRSSLLTGRMPSAHGVRHNGISLDPDANTFARALRGQGWVTALVGKAHFQNMGYGEGLAASFYPGAGDAVEHDRPAGWDRWEDAALHQERWVDIPEDFYGFDHVELVVDHGDTAGGHYHQWLVAQGVDREARCGWWNAPQASEHWYQVYQPALPEELSPTSWVTERTVAFLDGVAAARATGDDRPFLVQCSYAEPHHPFCPPGRWYDRYDPADIPLPATFDADHSRSMRHLRGPLRTRGVAPLFPVMPWAPTAEQFREIAAREYGSIGHIDDGVGRVLAALDRHGLADDTVVIFTSDHGDLFGDHGILLKGAMHYDGNIRVPLVIADPSRPGGSRTDALVSSVDLAPTILERCGVPAYAGIQGRSILGLVDDPSGPGHDEVVIEEDEPLDVLGTGDLLRMVSLRTDDARLTLYDGVPDGELFLLDDDPDEEHNRWADPGAAGARAELTERLARAQLRLIDRCPRPTHFT